MLESLHELAQLARNSQPAPSDVASACDVVRRAIEAEDVYIIRSGDPYFVRLGCKCPPVAYEITQKGYWLIWRELAARPRVPVGVFTVSDRMVRPGRRAREGRPGSHIATILPSDESNSEILIARGPWPEGLSAEQVSFMETAQPLLAALVSHLLDADKRRRQQHQLEALADVAKAFNEARDDEGALTSVATALSKASGIDWVTLSVYSDDLKSVVGSAMNVARHSGTETAAIAREGRLPAIAADQPTMIGQWLAARGPLLTPDVFAEIDIPELKPYENEIAALRKYYERAHVLSTAVFPMIFQGKALGTVLFASCTARQFDEDEVRFLTALVSQAATAIKGFRLYRELELSREEIREREQRFRALVQNASDMITVLGTDTMIQYQSPSIDQTLGHQPEELEGTPLVKLVHEADIPVLMDFLHSTGLRPEGIASAEVRMRHRDGRWHDIEMLGSDRRNDPAIVGYVINARDVTERKLLEEQLRHQALHDPLTKLANRTRFTDRLEHALLLAERKEAQVAVLFMDLDNFKLVNDTLGHNTGDRLLTAVAERVQRALRPADTVARLGGDEFAILIEDVTTPEDANSVAERIFGALAQPFEIEEREILVRASIGIALSGELGGGLCAEDLLRHADLAMYVAKARGKERFELFEATMLEAMTEHVELVNDLEHAAERDQLVLAYQPIVILSSGEVVGFEALVRWRHPARGLIAPAQFIPLAEESGAIVEIGRWVLRAACTQAADWQRRYNRFEQWTVSVNVSPRQLQHSRFVEEVATILGETGLPASSLTLELTESAMMQDVEGAVERLRALKEIGVKLALDDFGTGYSSLSHLRRFPFDLLKMDKSFVDSVGGPWDEKELTHAILELGRTLDMQVIAEGIERPEQLARLKALQCDMGQGYYFSEPVSAVVMEQLLAKLGRTEAA